ncbi:hypothetical protein [Clostridium tagluense]|uniref:Uncharacterized protein n=1 Tax=Clostridium tagluense TaxID=360422 RepID=A0A401UQD8_9CLOT|nr:hypothetical protein [Clostridium tagluense]GCD11749.1 hypothetical protein Ctaglu_33720 [Clostridium tagluense]
MEEDILKLQEILIVYDETIFNEDWSYRDSDEVIQAIVKIWNQMSSKHKVDMNLLLSK